VRTPAISQLGISQHQLAMPEILWKSYIDFEVAERERERARALSIGPKYVVIFMACCDSDAIIKSVMENKNYHAVQGNPKTMVRSVRLVWALIQKASPIPSLAMLINECLPNFIFLTYTIGLHIVKRPTNGVAMVPYDN
jgi:hypothetical protein